MSILKKFCANFREKKILFFVIYVCTFVDIYANKWTKNPITNSGSNQQHTNISQTVLEVWPLRNGFMSEEVD